MKRKFELTVAEWMPSLPPDNDPTVAKLSMRLYETLITECADRESRSISDALRVSARTLAGWFVRNYWRLTSEGKSARERVDWLIAHNMASAGNGYTWPKLIIASDGVMVRISDRSYEEDRYADVRFIGYRRPHFVTLDEFTSEVCRFVDLVVRRLRDIAPSDSLIGAWEDLVSELAEPETVAYRRIEAKLGYGINEAPEEEVLSWDGAAVELGDAAVDELLTAHTSLEEAIALRDAARTADATINVERIEKLAHRTRAGISDVGTRAWRPAAELAACLRRELEISGPVDPDTLTALFDYNDDVVVSSGREQAAGWDDTSKIRVAARRNNAPGARLEVSRLIGDYLAFGDGPFRPVLDTNSWRQQFQRSFGQAFLAPIELIRERKPSDRGWTERDLESVANDFYVSSWVIDDALRNNGDIPQTGIIDRELRRLEAT